MRVKSEFKLKSWIKTLWYFQWGYTTEKGGAGVNEYNTISVEGCGHFPNAGTLANNNKMSANINLCCEVRWRKNNNKMSANINLCFEVRWRKTGKPHKTMTLFIKENWRSAQYRPLHRGALKEYLYRGIRYKIPPHIVNTPPMVKSKSRFIVPDTVNPPLVKKLKRYNFCYLWVSSENPSSAKNAVKTPTTLRESTF